jgi:triacylglycerol lipase
MTPYAFALLAQEAYTSTPDVGVENSASRAIVRQTDAGLVIAFPGSDNEECWRTNFDIETVNVEGVGVIHAGFWNAWLAIADGVEKAIGDQPVTFVGHSLGAALAVCAAVSRTLAGKPLVAVYGFEPPRVSPDLGVRALLSTIPVHLYRNGLDIVTDLPPQWNQSALLIPIGVPELPFPNTLDHMMPRVLDALAATTT